MSNAEPWTRDRFEAYYNRGDILPILKKYAGIVLPCRNCDDENCHGWKMSRLHWKDDDITIYGVTEEEWAEAARHRLDLIRELG